MTEQTNADLIANNRRWVQLHRANQYQAEAAKRMTEVLDALEAVEQRAEAWRVASEQTRLERDRAEAAEQRAEDAEREMHARELHHFEEEERAAGLAAVIERAEDFVTRHYLDTQMGQAVLTELSTPLGDALRERDAEKWDEGHSRGWSDAQEAHDVRQDMARSDWHLCTPNPYREEQD